jgi:hypothetical protein
MTTLSITGQRGDHFVTVTWTDGELSGDADAIAMLQLLAEEFEGRPLRAIVGPVTVTNHLSNPYTACALMKSVFKYGTVTQDGSLPEIIIPPGAIA